MLRNGKLHYVHPMWDTAFSYTDRNYDGADVNYYIRAVQSDMESAWSSPFFFKKL
ncbi:MAG: hypothetical protein FWF92_10415 [Oscillospiraceae bacterium]|nr:hypothetical protein [Oscillospiraceae bacterium]